MVGSNVDENEAVSITVVGASGDLTISLCLGMLVVR